MTDITNILNQFTPISLEEMDAVKLLDRMDRKYIFHTDRLEAILLNLKENYRILEVKGLKCSRYETRYYDTPGFEMYVQHHNGKLNRHKVRFREYLDSGIGFFEVKFKSNKGRTIKDRVKLRTDNRTIDGETEFLLRKKTRYNASMLQEAIQVNYSRITLVHNEFRERLTLDLDLTYNFRGNLASFPTLVIAEIKQARSAGSPFCILMQDNFIPTLSLSKYCFGIASLNPDVKKNNLKPKLHNVQKLCFGNA